jgi:hypothetical protein
MSPLSSLARRAPVPVYPAIGPHRQAEVERLLARPGLRRALTPRDAAVLLIAGDIPGAAALAVSRVHDQLAHPRITIRWQAEDGDAIARRLSGAWAALCDGSESEADLLHDEPPNAWRGVGPHGQGGKGMMGGTPYGRPMAMTGEDIRDGLQLDRYSAQVGPFAPMLPPGLVLDLTLQGDVICEAAIGEPAFAQPAGADVPALCAARMLRLQGLDAAADRSICGHRPRAAGVRRALPAGLGRVGDTDARDRLAAWLGGKAVSVPPLDLPALLRGAEWSEAALILASLPPSAIIRAARPGEAA